MSNLLPASQEIINVYTCPHPFKMERDIIHMRPGQTILELLEEIQPNPALRTHAYVEVDGYEYHSQDWPYVIPKPGSVVVIRVMPSGRGIASIFVAIAAIVVSAVAFWAAPALIGVAAGGVGASLFAGVAGMATGIVGSLLLNALIPPAKPKAAALPYSPALSFAGIGSSQDQESPTKFVSGSQNVLNKWGKLPSLLGYMRITPIKLAEDYTEVVGKDQYVRCLFGQYGPIDITDIKIGDTALSSFSGVEQEIRNGYDTDAAITLYTKDIHEEAEQILLEYNVENIRTTQSGVQEISVDITCPNGCYSVDKYTGNRGSATVTVEVKYRVTSPPGDWIYADDLVITSSSASATRIGQKWTASGQYDICLKRKTPADDAQTVTVCYWTALRSIKAQEAVNFPDPLAKIALRIKASDQLNGTVDELNFLGKSICPDWDSTSGTWITRITNNPASLYRFVLQSKAAPYSIADSRIDLVKLQYWHTYCVTKGFIYERNVDEAIGWRDLLREIAAAGRAAPCEPDGLYSVVLDELQEVVTKPLFTSRNTRDLEVAIVYPDLPHGLRIPFNNRDDNYQQDERIVLDDNYQIDGLDAWGNSHPEYPQATKFEQVNFPGVTDPDHVFKLGRYHIAAARLRYRTITFTTHFKHLVCTRGDVVHLQNDVMLVGLGSGRIRSFGYDYISGYTESWFGGKWFEDGWFSQLGDPIYSTDIVTSFVMDNTFIMEEGNTYAIKFNSVRNDDDDVPRSTEIWFTVETVAGESNILTLITPMQHSACPDIGDLGAFGIYGEEIIELVVNKIEMQSNLEARVTCLDAAPGIHTADVGTIPAFDPHITLPAAWYIPTVISTRSDGAVLVRGADGKWLSRILVTFSILSGVVKTISGIEGQYWRTDSPDAPIITVGPVPIADSEIGLLPVEDGVEYNLRFRYVKSNNRRGDWCNTYTHTVEGKTAPPNDVLGLVVYQIDSAVTAEWSPVPDLDWAYYEIRYGDVGCAWDDGVVANGTFSGTSFTTTTIPSGVWDIMIKAVDSFGNYSTNPGRKTFNVYSFYTVLLERLASPSWAGTLTNFVRDPLTGYLNPESQDSASGNDNNWVDYYCHNPYATSVYEGTEIDLGSDLSVRLWARIYADLGPSVVGTDHPQLSIDYKVDGGSYDGFEDWSIGLLTGRYIKYKVTIDNSGNGPSVLKNLDLVVDVS